MLESQYKLHVFSRLPMFLKSNDLPEEDVIKEIAKLHRDWDYESGAERHYTYQERAQYFRNDLAQNAVVVLVEDVQEQEMVGYGEMINEDNVPLFALSYVLPGYRRQGLFDTITKTICDAGVKAGYEFLLAEPARDYKAGRVLERNGFVVVDREGSNVILRKELRPGMGESGLNPPGLPPRARR